jgi:hypothetical protein
MKRVLFAAGCFVFVVLVETVYAGGIFGKSASTITSDKRSSSLAAGTLKRSTCGG